jgi:ectoine hydroxylase-related dioxygenase (phytanoyl-CoA dioxygenase family)
MGELPGVQPLLFTARFNALIDQLFGKDYFLVKAIYFNKPAHNNWLVPWHQDLTISVDKKETIEGFGPWTTKQGLCAVQPTAEYLEAIYTIRIHLDNCDETNGALKVVKGSHKLGKMKDQAIAALDKPATLCPVGKGGIMVMQPLLLHASGKRTGAANRRVIHLELTSKILPAGLQWREYADRNQLPDPPL